MHSSPPKRSDHSRCCFQIAKITVLIPHHSKPRGQGRANVFLFPRFFHAWPAHFCIFIKVPFEILEMKTSRGHLADQTSSTVFDLKLWWLFKSPFSYLKQRKQKKKSLFTNPVVDSGIKKTKPNALSVVACFAEGRTSKIRRDYQLTKESSRKIMRLHNKQKSVG